MPIIKLNCDNILWGKTVRLKMYIYIYIFKFSKFKGYLKMLTFSLFLNDMMKDILGNS